MDLSGILERNQTFVRGRTPRPLSPVEAIPLAVVACYDPRLDDLLLPSLGFRPGEIFLLRSAGALLRPDGGVLRSLGLAIFLFGVRDLIVLGHTSCRMARFDSSVFIDAFRSRGVPREAFGSGDLRTWAGAIPDPVRGVTATVRAIRSAPFLPNDLTVAGMVLDDESGALQVVVRPGEPVPSTASPREEVPPAEAPQPPAAPPSPPGAPAAPDAAGPLLDAAESFLGALHGKQRWIDEARRLREALQRHRNPITRAKLLERFVHAAAAESREVGMALERLRRETAAAKRNLDLEALLRAFLRRAGPS